MAASGRRRGLTFILLALLLILILGVVVFLMRDQLFPNSQAQVLATPTPDQEMKQIVIMAQPVTRGTILNEAVLVSIQYPKSQMVENLFITDMQSVIGKRARYDLMQGTPLTSSLITDQPIGSFAAQQVPKGMVSISIPINKLAPGSYDSLALQPGDHVNIIGSVSLVDIDLEFQSKLPNSVGVVTPPQIGVGADQSPSTITLGVNPSTKGRAEQDPSLNQPIYLIPSEPQRPRLVSQTVIQDAIILWVGELNEASKQQSPISGQTTQQTPTAVPTPISAQPTITPAPSFITMVVTPQDAITLNYLLLSDSKLILALRSAGDDEKIMTEPVTLQFIMEQYRIPYPSKLPFGLAPIISPGTIQNTPAPIPQ